MPEYSIGSTSGRGDVFKDKDKPASMRESNITAAKGEPDHSALSNSTTVIDYDYKANNLSKDEKFFSIINICYRYPSRGSFIT